MRECKCRPFATVILVLFIGGGALFAMPETAEACSPGPSFEMEILQDNTPDCVTLPESPVLGRTVLEISNTCMESVTLQKLECQTCQPELTIPGGETKELELVRADMRDGETMSQTYAWMIGDNQEGVVETELTHTDTSDACRGFCNMAPDDEHAPSPLPMVLTVLVGLFGLHLSRR